MSTTRIFKCCIVADASTCDTLEFFAFQLLTFNRLCQRIEGSTSLVLTNVLFIFAIRCLCRLLEFFLVVVQPPSVKQLLLGGRSNSTLLEFLARWLLTLHC